MTFSRFATSETSEFLARLLARRSRETLDSFAAFRQALDEVTQKLEVWANVEEMDEVKAFVARLAEQATTEARAVAVQSIQESQATIEALRKTVQGLEGDLQRAKEHAETAAAESADLRQVRQAHTGQLQKLAEALDDAQARLGAADEQRRATASQLSTMSTQIAALKSANAESERGRRYLQLRLDGALTTEAALRDRIAEHELEIARTRGEVQTSVLASESFDGLLAACDEFEKAGTAEEVVAALADALARNFSRVARFRVGADRLEGVSQTGFDAESDMSQVVLPLSSNDLFAKALLAGHVETFAAAELGEGGAPLGGSPECALTLPIAVGGEVVSLLYADDSSESAVPDRSSLAVRAKFAELLRRQAAPYLARHAARPDKLDELDAYATLLLDEVEYMHGADAANGHEDADLQRRLDENLRSARQFYARRVALEAPSAVSLFDERLAARMASRAKTPFGRDLAAVGLRSGLASEQVRVAAEPV
jgi:hypothetical protein